MNTFTCKSMALNQKNWEFQNKKEEENQVFKDYKWGGDTDNEVYTPI